MAQCRQEVAEYGIPAEQAAEYVDGCFMSKGGYSWPGPQDQDIATGEAESLPEGQPVNGMNETLALPESNNGVR